MTEALAWPDGSPKNAPLAVRLSKQVMKQAAELPEDEAWAINDAVFGRSAVGRRHGGCHRFAEKREPNWTGK